MRHCDLEVCDPVTWCHIHAVHEPDMPGDYKVCGECGHVFRRLEDLLAEDDKWQVGVGAHLREVADQLALVGGYDVADAVSALNKLRGAQIWSCPLCTHAF